GPGGIPARATDPCPCRVSRPYRRPLCVSVALWRRLPLRWPFASARRLLLLRRLALHLGPAAAHLRVLAVGLSRRVRVVQVGEHARAGLALGRLHLADARVARVREAAGRGGVLPGAGGGGRPTQHGQGGQEHGSAQAGGESVLHGREPHSRERSARGRARRGRPATSPTPKSAQGAGSSYTGTRNVT